MSNERAVQLVDAATWLHMSGDTEGARRLFEQALKLDPSNTKALEYLAGTRATASMEEDISGSHSPKAILAAALDGDWGAATHGDAPPPPPPTWDVETTRQAPVPPELLGPPPPPAGLAQDFESTRVARVPAELLGPPPPPPDAVMPTVTAPMGKTAEMYKPPPMPVTEDALFGDVATSSGVVPPPPPVVDIDVPPPPPAATADDLGTLPMFNPSAMLAAAQAESDRTSPHTTVPDLIAAEVTDAGLPSLPPPPPPPVAEPRSSAWDSGPQLVGTPENRTMELLTGSPPPAPPPAPEGESVERLMRSAKDLLDLDDHTGAMELILKAKGLAPNDPEVEAMRVRSEATLVAMYESKLRSLAGVPRVLLKDDEIIWLNLDHRAGFVLAQIDGAVTFDDLFSLSGMSRIDTARILAQLIDEGVISRG